MTRGVEGALDQLCTGEEGSTYLDHVGGERFQALSPNGSEDRLYEAVIPAIPGSFNRDVTS